MVNIRQEIIELKEKCPRIGNTWLVNLTPHTVNVPMMDLVISVLPIDFKVSLKIQHVPIHEESSFLRKEYIKDEDTKRIIKEIKELFPDCIIFGEKDLAKAFPKEIVYIKAKREEHPLEMFNF